MVTDELVRDGEFTLTGELLKQGYDTANVHFARKIEFDISLDTLFDTVNGTPLAAFLASCSKE